MDEGSEIQALRRIVCFQNPRHTLSALSHTPPFGDAEARLLLAFHDSNVIAWDVEGSMGLVGETGSGGEGYHYSNGDAPHVLAARRGGSGQ
jgi:hypothetical protein